MFFVLFTNTTLAGGSSFNGTSNSYSDKQGLHTYSWAKNMNTSDVLFLSTCTLAEAKQKGFHMYEWLDQTVFAEMQQVWIAEQVKMFNDVNQKCRFAVETDGSLGVITQADLATIWKSAFISTAPQVGVNTFYAESFLNSHPTGGVEKVIRAPLSGEVKFILTYNGCSTDLMSAMCGNIMPLSQNQRGENHPDPKIEDTYDTVINRHHKVVVDETEVVRVPRTVLAPMPTIAPEEAYYDPNRPLYANEYYRNGGGGVLGRLMSYLFGGTGAGVGYYGSNGTYYACGGSYNNGQFSYDQNQFYAYNNGSWNQVPYNQTIVNNSYYCGGYQNNNWYTSNNFTTNNNSVLPHTNGGGPHEGPGASAGGQASSGNGIPASGNAASNNGISGASTNGTQTLAQLHGASGYNQNTNSNQGVNGNNNTNTNNNGGGPGSGSGAKSSRVSTPNRMTFVGPNSNGSSTASRQSSSNVSNGSNARQNTAPQNRMVSNSNQSRQTSASSRGQVGGSQGSRQSYSSSSRNGYASASSNRGGAQSANRGYAQSAGRGYAPTAPRSMSSSRPMAMNGGGGGMRSGGMSRGGGGRH